MRTHRDKLFAALLLSLLMATLAFGSEKKDGEKAGTPEGNAGKSVLEGMVRIPAGEFIMGSNEVDTEMFQQRFGMDDIPYQDEHPERKVYLKEFYIDKYEVTNGRYKEFLDDAKDMLPKVTYLHMMPLDWKDQNYGEGEAGLPVVGISWHNAKAYCAWSGKRLPTEAEWEKAARGTDGRKFPWGNTFDETKANVMGLSGGIAPVGKYEGDVSPYGVHDMAGNITEWVDDWYLRYPGNEFRNDKYGEKEKVVRGWHWGGIGHYILEMFYRTSSRFHMQPNVMLKELGFRCAYSDDAT